ncbi:MAG TPA: hydroxymethylpyrimidine/phosphomethylpyrimidine kinase [bacterium]|nr:hydroxymethylpyrimidine/phosphomethylpyrimidine kinase [bacterium]
MKKQLPPLPVLAIGGLDPSGQAGLFADVRVFENLKFPYRVAATAITAQSEKKFIAWKPVDLKLFRAQLAAAGPKLAGVKVGMLGDAAHLREVSRWLKKIRPPWVVWDPVWRSSTGGQLFRGKASDLFALLPQVDVWTPNLPEAELFLGRKIRNLAEAHRAAIELWRMEKKKPGFVVLKGGHLPKTEPASDLAIDEAGIHELRGARFAASKRGTGCTFASALLAALVSGRTRLDSVRFAKAYVRGRLFTSNPRG